MPYKALQDPERRELTLRALSAKAQELADKYNISHSTVYKLKEEAERTHRPEGEFWDAVRKRLS